MGTNAAMINFVFHNASTALGTGAELSIQGRMLTGNIALTGTSSSFSVTFEGRAVDGGEWYPLKAINLSTFALSSIATVMSLWSVDLNGMIKFRVNLTAIGNGNLSVVGRIVD